MRRRVVITGMGSVNPLGHDVESMWTALLAGESGSRPLELFDARTYPTKFASQVRGYELADHIPNAADHVNAARHCRFAVGAAVEAWTQAKLEGCPSLDKDRVGIYLGCGEGSLDFITYAQLLADTWTSEGVNMPAWAPGAMQRFGRYQEMEQESHMVAAHLAHQFGARGPSTNVLTACAASTQALGEATWMVRRGEVDVVISGGAHSMIHPLGVTGFNLLTALSRRNDDIPNASRPFDQTRDGFVLGEGSSILILEDYEFAKARGATVLAEIVGYGTSADAYRVTDQDPAGDGAAIAMRFALEDARLKPEQIDYISAHGTGTQQNDAVETRAMKQIFGATAPRVPVSSVKSALGHLIAAAGATELITCILAIRDQILPPTIHLHTPDPECDMDYIPNVPRKAKVDICMSNSMGFGGQNDSIIITRPE